MEKLQIKMEDITEDNISDLISFLDTGKVPEGTTESRLAIIYGRLKARGNKMDIAEERLAPTIEKKKENYKRGILNQIEQGINDMRNENGGVGHYVYEIANIKEREKGRTLLIGFQDRDINDKIKWRHSVLIRERLNPEFFEEMLNKYKPKETALYDKPF